MSDTHRTGQKVNPTLKVSNNQQFVSHLQRTDGVFKQKASIIARCSILPAPKKTSRFQRQNRKFQLSTGEYQLNFSGLKPGSNTENQANA
jgi:hypothetical protein